MDAACVVYMHQHPTGHSRLTNLNLPAGATLEQIVEAIDFALGSSDTGRSSTLQPLAGLDLTYLRSTYELTDTSDVYRAIQTELQKIQTLERWAKREISQLTRKLEEQQSPGLSHEVLSIQPLDSTSTVLQKLITLLAGHQAASQELTRRVVSLEQTEDSPISIPVSNSPGNRLQATSDGLYVAPLATSEVPQTSIQTQNAGRSVQLYAEGENRHTLSADLRIADSANGLKKNLDGTVSIDPEALLDAILATPTGSSIRQKFKLITTQP